MVEIDNKSTLDQQTTGAAIAGQMPVGAVPGEAQSRQGIKTDSLNSSSGTSPSITTSVPSTEIVDTIRELTKPNRRIAAKRTAQTRISRPQHIAKKSTAPRKTAAMPDNSVKRKRGRPPKSTTQVDRLVSQAKRTAGDLSINLPMPREERRHITIPTSVTTPVLLILLLGIIFVAHRSIQGLRNNTANEQIRSAAVTEVVNTEKSTATAEVKAANKQTAEAAVPETVAAKKSGTTTPTANTTPATPAPMPKPNDVPVLAAKTSVPSDVATAAEKPSVNTEKNVIVSAAATTTAPVTAPATTAAVEPSKDGWTAKTLKEEELLKTAKLTKVEIPNGFIYVPQQRPETLEKITKSEPGQSTETVVRTWRNWTDPYTNGGPLDLDGAASRQRYLSLMNTNSSVAKSTKKAEEAATAKSTSANTPSSTTVTTTTSHASDLAFENTTSRTGYYRNTSDYSNPWNSGGALDLDGPQARSVYQKQLTSRK